MMNPIARGDLRVRTRSRKIFAAEAFYLGILAVLAWLGMPPELSPQTHERAASLTTALLVVQAILITYFASACASQEIAVEGEKSPVDLVFAPFAPRTIVAGKSVATLATAGYWLVLGAPLVALAAGIRQEPVAGLVRAGALIIVVAWSVGQMGLWLGVAIESEFSRTLAHWALLLAVFAGTLAMPGAARALNPVIALDDAQRETISVMPYVVYTALGLAWDAAALVALRKYLPAGQGAMRPR